MNEAIMPNNEKQMSEAIMPNNKKQMNEAISFNCRHYQTPRTKSWCSANCGLVGSCNSVVQDHRAAGDIETLYPKSVAANCPGCEFYDTISNSTFFTCTNPTGTCFLH